MGTLPIGLIAKAHGRPMRAQLWLGEYEIDNADFLNVARRVLTSTPLIPRRPQCGKEDVRLYFVTMCKQLKEVSGFNQGNLRLEDNGMEWPEHMSGLRVKLDEHPEFSVQGRFGYDLSLEDFLFVVKYVIKNTDLEGMGDPRIAFVREVVESTFKTEDGQKRLVLPA